MKLIIDNNTNTIVGMTDDAQYNIIGFTVVEQPNDFEVTQINDYTLVDGILTIDPLVALERVKTNKLREIRTYFDGVMQGIKAGVANYEVATWDTQRVEYTAWLSDTNAKTPYVDILATTRGIDRDIFMGRIGSNIINIATIQGKQQALESLINSLNTIEAISKVEINVK